MRAIAGVANERFNVFGLMPHPEHAVEAMLGGDDGLKIFDSIIECARHERRPVAAARRARVDLAQARAHGLTADEFERIENCSAARRPSPSWASSR